MLFRIHKTFQFEFEHLKTFFHILISIKTSHAALTYSNSHALFELLQLLNSNLKHVFLDIRARHDFAVNLYWNLSKYFQIDSKACALVKTD